MSVNKYVNNERLPGVPLQVEDGIVQTERFWRLSRMSPSSRGRAGLRVRQPEDRLTERQTGWCQNHFLGFKIGTMHINKQNL